MTTPTTEASPTPPTDERRSWLRDHSELGVCVLLLALGALVLGDALTMDVEITQRGPVGPKTVPIVVGIGLLVIAALLAVDVLRGGRGEAEGGEDVDLSEPADWRTVLLLAGCSWARPSSSSPPDSPSRVPSSSGERPSRSAAAASTGTRSSRPCSPSSRT